MSLREILGNKDKQPSIHSIIKDNLSELIELQEEGFTYGELHKAIEVKSGLTFSKNTFIKYYTDFKKDTK